MRIVVRKHPVMLATIFLGRTVPLLAAITQNHTACLIAYRTRIESNLFYELLGIMHRRTDICYEIPPKVDRKKNLLQKSVSSKLRKFVNSFWKQKKQLFYYIHVTPNKVNMII